MKIINAYASSITIKFHCKITDEDVELHVEPLPEPNVEAEHVNGSEVFKDYLKAAENGRTYRVDVYKTMYEGRVFLYDVTDEEFEIEDFEVKEGYDNDDVAEMDD